MGTSNLEIKIKALIENLGDIDKLRSALDAIEASADGVGTSSETASSKLAKIKAAAKDAAGAVEELGTSTQDLSTWMNDILGDEAAASIEEVGNAAVGTADQLRDLGAAGEEMLAFMDEAAISKTGVALGDLGGTAAETTAALYETSAGAQELTTAFNDLGSSNADGTLTGVGAAAKAAEAGLKTLGQTGKETFGALEDVNKAADGAPSKFSALSNGLKEAFAGFRGLVNSASEVPGKFQELTGGAKNVEGAVKNLSSGLIDNVKNMGVAGEGLAALASACKPLLAGLMALAGIKLTFDYLKEAANYAARVETLGITLKVVGQNAGYSGKELDTYEASLKKAGISTEAARQAMTQMMQAGLSLGTQLGQTTPQVTRLARAAQDLAVVTGENSSQTFQRLITNIQQMDTMGLRFMGLMVNVTAAEEKFATSLGTTAGALTEAQKRQAVLNEVLVQADKLAGAYELSMETVGKKLTSMVRYSDELKMALGNHLLPVYGALVDAGTDLMKNLEKIASSWDKTGEAGKAYGRGVKAVVDPLVEVFSILFDWVGRVGVMLAPAFEMMGVAIGAVVDVFADLMRLLGDGSGIFTGLQIAIDAITFGLAAFADGMLVLKMGMMAIIGISATLASAILTPLISLAQWLPLPKNVVDEMKKAQVALDGIAASAEKSVGETSKKFLEGETNVGKFTEGLFKSKSALEGSVTPAQAYQTAITTVTRAQNENTMSSVDVKNAVDGIRGSMEQARAENRLSQTEYDKLNVKLGAIEKKMGEDLDAAFKKLKTSSSELKTGISADAATIIGALKEVAQNGLATADQFYKAFADKVSMAKNVEELGKFSEALQEAKKRWPEAPNLFAEAQGQVMKKFDEIYEKQLKAMSTSADWDTLRAAIVKMGEDGSLSASKVAVALEEGEKAVRRMQPAYVAAADASKQMGDAIKGVEVDIKKLDDAIKITASQVEGYYNQMSKGYTALSESVKTETGRQVAEIEQRYTAEVGYINSTVKNADTAEQAKTTALLNSLAAQLKAIDSSTEQQLALQGKIAKADEAALAAKLKAIDTESAKIKEAMTGQVDATGVQQQKLKDLDLKRLNAVQEHEAKVTSAKLATLNTQYAKYQETINKLIAEEDRLLGKVKAIEEQKAQARMSMEEKIRAIQKSAMTDYEAYQANMTDVATNQARAREAASRGDYEAAKQYLSQAKSDATALNTVVKDGERIMVDKATASRNAIKALEDIGKTEQDIFSKQAEGTRQVAGQVRTELNAVQAAAQKTREEMKSLQDQINTKTELNIKVNDEAARTKLTDLDNMIEKRDRLMVIKTDLEQGKAALDRMMKDIEAGRTIKIDADTAKAMGALKSLREEAVKTHNTELVMKIDKALAAISTTVEKVQALGKMEPGVNVKFTSTGYEVVKGQVDSLKAEDKKEYKTIADFIEKTPGAAKDYIVKIKDADGKTIYTQANMVTADFEAGAQKIEVFKKRVEKGDLNPPAIKANIETNADAQAAKIKEAMKPYPVLENVSNVKTDAKQASDAIGDVMKKLPTTENQSNVKTDAPQKEKEIDAALEQKSVESSHNITTNVDEVLPNIDQALETQNVESTHNIVTNVDEVLPNIDQALETQEVESTHNIATNVDDVLPNIDQALETQDVESTHTITSNADELTATIQALNNIVTQSMHTVYSNAQEALQEIYSLQGRATYSTHTIYVTKEYLFGLGGIFGFGGFFAEGGPVGGVPPGKSTRLYPYLSGGTIPGAGNYDKVPRTLDAGAFVMQKAAVQAHGADRLLNLFEKAKQLPKALSPLSGQIRAFLMPGEIVVSKDVSSRLGYGALNYLNDPRSANRAGASLPLHFASGGPVGPSKDFLREALDLGSIGFAFARGGAVAATPATAQMTVDLRGNTRRAQVAVAPDQQGNLLEVLRDLRSRAS